MPCGRWTATSRTPATTRRCPGRDRSPATSGARLLARRARATPAGPAQRARVVGLLAEADRLSALAELVGVDTLPGRERMVVLGGRLLREAVLQQSSLSSTDAYCRRGEDGRAGGRGPRGDRPLPGDWSPQVCRPH